MASSFYIHHIYFLSQLKERIHRDATIAARIKVISDCAKRLVEHYNDADGIRSQELHDLGSSMPLQQFRERMDAVYAAFEKNKKLLSMDPSTAATSHDVKVRLQFRQFENGGRMVDLTELYERFCNLSIYQNMMEAEGKLVAAATEQEPKDEKQKDASPADKEQAIMTSIPPITYFSYLFLFEDMAELLPRKAKIGASPGALKEYTTYLSDLVEYLSAFFAKTQPLVPTSGLLSIMEANFVKAWESKNVLGWFPGAKMARPSKEIPGRTFVTPAIFTRHDNTSADSASSDTASELSDDALRANPLFCVACDKLFAKQPMFDQHLSGKKHIRAVKLLEEKGGANATSVANTTATSSTNSTSASSMMAALRTVARLEYMLSAWADLLRLQINETIFFTEKKQTKSHSEMLAELAAMDVDVGLSDDDLDTTELEEKERARRANPHNVPLGPDGQPIAYWLYKLHGLNIYYTCEICGDYKYRGERAFFKHFKDWRHTHFLSLLGIPNSDHFTNITKIEDAQILFKKLQDDAAKGQFKQDDEEEVEDVLGNVYKRSVYNGLKERGLIN